MIKGIPQKLLAYEMFLEKCEEWRGKVVLVQIAVPSRSDSGVNCKFLNFASIICQTSANIQLNKTYIFSEYVPLQIKIWRSRSMRLLDASMVPMAR